MARLTSKIALISGGASGIGKAIAQLFLEEGARVVITDINASLLDQTVAELSAFGNISGVAGDVRSMADAGRMVGARALSVMAGWTSSSAMPASPASCRSSSSARKNGTRC